MREAYLDGLSNEEGVPFRIEAAPAARLPAVRKVAAGVAVIDLEAMRQELEANPAARRRT